MGDIVLSHDQNRKSLEVSNTSVWHTEEYFLCCVTFFNPCVPSSHLSPLLSLPFSFLYFLFLPIFTSLPHFCLYPFSVLLSLWIIVPHSPPYIENQIHMSLKNVNCKFWSSAQFLLLRNGSSRLYNANNFALWIQLHIYLQLRFYIVFKLCKP